MWKKYSSVLARKKIKRGVVVFNIKSCLYVCIFVVLAHYSNHIKCNFLGKSGAPPLCHSLARTLYSV